MSSPRSVRLRALSPLRDFLKTESAGGVLLIAAAALALLWANSPWSAGYDALWATRAVVNVGGHGIDLDLRHFVNDGLMAVFFLIVGLEIKRELTDGHLSDRRAALLPLVAAIGGMAVPAVIYLAIAGRSAPRGWAIPVATDIALAVGVVSLAGALVAPSMRAFLLGLAIVDDIGAILIIAVFFSTSVDVAWIAVGLAAVLGVVIGRRLQVRRGLVYLVLGVVLWYALKKSGVHPTLAGVAMGLLTPSIPHVAEELVDIDEIADVSDIETARATAQLAKTSISEVEWLQHVLHPWTSFVIVPVFALANSGIELTASGLRDAISSPLSWGVFVGLVVGKPVGVFGAINLAARLGIAERPHGARDAQVWGVGAAAGIGFTVALFITELAFDDATSRTQAKLSVLVASVTAALLASFVLRLGRRRV